LQDAHQWLRTTERTIDINFEFSAFADSIEVKFYYRSLTSDRAGIRTSFSVCFALFVLCVVGGVDENCILLRCQD
jgi:hypothetical protein